MADIATTAARNVLENMLSSAGGSELELVKIRPVDLPSTALGKRRLLLMTVCPGPGRMQAGPDGTCRVVTVFVRTN